MFKIKYILILATLLSCSTNGLKEQTFSGERSVAAAPKNCSSLISDFLSNIKKVEADSFRSKLSKYGYKLIDNDLYKGNTYIAKLEVINPRYLYEWQDKEYHDAWVANGGIFKEEMDQILSEPAQTYGKGYYVSLNPTDSRSYGSHLTVFKVEKPLILLTKLNQSVFNHKKFVNDLREIGFAGRFGTATWLNIINEDYLSKAVKIDQNIFDYTVEKFQLNPSEWAELVNQMSLAGKKISYKDQIAYILEQNDLNLFRDYPKILIESIQQMNTSEINKVAGKINSTELLGIYNSYHKQNGSLSKEDYKILIKILQNSNNNFIHSQASQEFTKELVANMNREQFNQIANKANAPLFVQLYSELILAGKIVSDEEYKKIIDTVLSREIINNINVPLEAAIKFIKKMNYEQFSKFIDKSRLTYVDELMSKFEHSKAFFDLFDLFDIATIGKIKTDEALSFQEMLSYAKKYEEATANINFDQIKTSNDFKNLLKNVFEMDYTTRSEDVIMTPYINNKFTINISKSSYDYISQNKLLNLSQKKVLSDKSVDLMVSYLELENLENLKTIFSKSEYEAILKLKDNDKEKALKLMIDTFLKKLFDKKFYTQIPKLLYGKENSTNIDLYQIFVSLHPFEDGNGRAARLYYKWLGKNINEVPFNLLNEADILINHHLENPYAPKLMELKKIYYASKIWVISAESEEEMIKRAQYVLKNNSFYTEILKDLPYLKKRL